MNPIFAPIIASAVSSAASLLGSYFSNKSAREAEDRKTEIDARMKSADMQQQNIQRAQDEKSNALQQLIDSYRAGMGGLGGF